MANQIKLTAQPRSEAGRNAVKHIKSQGLVPAVVYGGKDQPVSLQVSAREISNILSHATSEHLLVDLEIADGAKVTNRLALIQEVQHHPVRGDVLHVDFLAVSADVKIHSEVPVETTGDSVGVKSYGGLLELSLHAVEVECLPKDLPEVIRIDVTHLNIGDALHLKDLQLPQGVVARGDGDLTVVRVAPPTVADPELTPATSAGPEVIKEKKDDAGDKK
jgi:large subunit ribosomal protein L25